MIKLIKLTKEYEKELGEMIDERKLDQEINHTNHSPWAIFKNDYHDFDYYLDNLEIKEAKDGKVEDSVFFLLDDKRNRLLGAINIRHELNEDLLMYGGHIGDGIRPSERRKGYGTKIIDLALVECRKLGIEKVLITCDKNNEASRKTIINNGGIKENEVLEDNDITERYWIDANKILETDRLILRQMNDNDFKSLKKVLSDPINMKYYPSPYDDEGVKKWINWCKASYKKRGFGLWAVIYKETGEMIGDCGISMQTIDDELKPELGYHLRLDYHRKNIGYEMASKVKDYFFNHFDFDELYSYMSINNEPSYKLAEKNGMIYQHIYKDLDGNLDKVYKITRKEWELEKKLQK